jgi:hypothetical protein
MYGLKRQGATQSTAVLRFTGEGGVVVPEGSEFGDTAGRIWKTTEEAVLDDEGTATAAAVCETPGAVYAGAETITNIVSAIAGLTGVTNPNGSRIGLNQETDAEARRRIRVSLAGKGNATAEAILAGIYGIPNVRNARIYVNDGDGVDERGIPGHSIACVVLGGNQQRIGDMIYGKKAPGVGTYGSVTVNVDTGDGRTFPVHFSRPNSRFIYFLVSLKRLAGFNEAVVKERITEEITAAVGEVGIGETLIMPSLFGRCYAAAGEYAGTFVIQSILGTTTATESSPEIATTEEIQLGWDERFVLQNSYGIRFVVV